MTAPALRVVHAPKGCISIEGGFRQLVPPGTYVVRFLYWETALVRQFGGSARVFLHFEVLEGDYYEVQLFASYPIRSLSGKPQRRGGFKLGRGSELLRQLGMLGMLRRGDRPSLEPLRKVILQVSVRTVRRNSHNRELPEALQYSVVSEMLKVHAGALRHEP